MIKAKRVRTLAKSDASTFLRKMAANTEVKAKIKDGYRRLLCDVAREEGLEVSPEELQQALREEKYRLADADLEGVVGGGGWGNLTPTS